MVVLSDVQSLQRPILASLIVFAVLAQAPPDRILGTVQSVSVSQITVKPDRGEITTVVLRGNTRVQRVPPEARDLTSAQPISAADLAAGDRVLVRGTATAEGFQATSVVVMSGQDIQRKNEQERMEWNRRGISGLVQSADPGKGEVIVTIRSFQGSQQLTVVTTQSTPFKRYAPDSIRFADAKDSAIKEIRPGDQLRALGEKNPEGTRLTAERVVFGTFRSVAGSVTEVNAAAGEMKIKDLNTGKPLLVRTRPDSQLKKMPQFPGRPPGGGPPGGPRIGMGMRGGPPGGGPPGGGPPDLSMMIERMPAAAIGDFTPGETVLVSSTVGAKPNELTAIVLLGGAEMLIARFSASSGQSPQGAQTAGPGMMGGGFGSGLDSMMGGFPIIQ